jgi:hypothetical protein
LYSLKYITAAGIKARIRGSDPPSLSGPEDIDIEAKDIDDGKELPSYDVPWGLLDEDGEEEYVDELDEHTLAAIATFGH